MFSYCGSVNTAVVGEFNSTVMPILNQKKIVIPYSGCLLTVFLSQDEKYHCKHKIIINKNVYFLVLILSS